MEPALHQTSAVATRDIQVQIVMQVRTQPRTKSPISGQIGFHCIILYPEFETIAQLQLIESYINSHRFATRKKSIR